MENYLEIKINWSQKINLDNIIDLENFQLNSKNSLLYKIYGDSLLYGRDVLLYIGITVNIRNRFNAHLKSTFGPVNNLKVSIGEILNQPKELNLEIPESILIANHKPAMNKEFIHEISPSANKTKIIILNHGFIGMLQSCCTNYWWLK